ncbi:hypothetical protein BG011_009090 [Mortierella polycephala]|uniref:DUF676 domain-containing protein n=1 Tax=Mortierella polycephala TaxID=41804 RepID=A0A9P6QAW8_9FUNG|nr:hypothetical protein BG011_009090 [Mortierella polycephala]
MVQKPLLVIQHKVSFSVGGIARYRIKVLPSQLSNIQSLQFRVRNSSPIYRNITPGSGPWKISVALIRNPERAPVVPELTPLIGCAQVCRMDAEVIEPVQEDDYVEGCNEWELEVLSEMVLLRNWVDVKVEVFAIPREGASGLAHTTSNMDAEMNTGTDLEVAPQVLQPQLVSCEYKNTIAICGATFPGTNNQDDEPENDLHLVLLTHGVHGTWLDMLYIKEQIDAHNANNGKTVTFLTDTNHAGTEEGIQMAGQRVALDILEFTGFCDTEQGKHLRRPSPSSTAQSRANSTPSSAITATASASGTTDTQSKNRNVRGCFPRGFSKVSIIGHSLGGLINIYALGYIEDVTKGTFFKTIQPVHFVTLATPLLGIGFEHPWVLGFALSLGCIGQTGKDLAFEDRSSRLKRVTLNGSTSSASPMEQESATNKETKSTTPATSVQECALDRDPEPLLLAMARPDSVSNRALRKFKDRTSYANIENDMAVRFKTSSMMGIPTFDLDKFFSPEGAATQPRKSIYHSALTSTMALLFPNVPTKAKFLSIADAPSPIVAVSHVAAEVSKKEVGLNSSEHGAGQKKSAKDKKQKHSRNYKSEDVIPTATPSSSRSTSRSSSPSFTQDSLTTKALTPQSTTAASLASKSRLDFAQLVAEGYHTEMDWTKIGVYIEYEAHVQIIVRRKWFNLDGWKCVQDLVERFDFT